MTIRDEFNPAPATLDTHSKTLVLCLLYPVQFNTDPSEGIDRVLNNVVASRADSSAFPAAIRAALASPEKLSTLIGQRHDEAAVREYLSAVLTRLEAPPSSSHPAMPGTKGL